MAATLGALVIEKHFTLDRNMQGPDHKASLEPFELKTMVQSIRGVEKAFGNGIKEPTDSEKEIMKLIKKSIVLNRDIPSGSILKKEDLTAKRPEFGISPKFLAKVLGKKVNRDIKKDEPLSFNDLEQYK
jgi:sialic acid synthase SpsE